jgi:hypothetical protein
MWYTRQQQPTIIGYWYSANGIGIAVGGLLGYVIGNVSLTLFLFFTPASQVPYQIKGALPSWRYEFLVRKSQGFSF